jgi:hypothetical protein
VELHSVEDDPNPPAIAVTDFGLQGVIWRWVRGFHAALYREYLPRKGVMGSLLAPVPIGKSLLETDPILPGHAKFVRVLRENRVSRTVDRIVCRNGKCRYDCTWLKTDDGLGACLFGLDIYRWSRRGTSFLRRRGCVGHYVPPGGIPVGASTATRIQFSLPAHDPLDPFDDE